MLRRSILDRPVAVLGQSLPVAALGLIVVVVLGSAFFMLGERSGVPLLSASQLSPALVMRGQVWRLMPWTFLETNGQSLVFASLMFGLFGRDLAGYWGGARYLLTCLGLALGAGLLTTVVGLLWSEVYRSQYLSVWPLVDALTVAWSLLFPNRTILFMFVLPAAGRNLMYITLGITVVFSIMYGFHNFVPHFLAMGLVYLHIRGSAAIAAQLRLRSLLSPKRTKSNLKVVQGEWNRDNRKDPNGSGWVH